MRVPKLLLTFCAAALGASFISARADDNAAQAAARAALMQKLNAASEQPETSEQSAPQSAPVMSSSDNAQPATQPAASNSNWSTPAAGDADTKTQSEAREALEQKLSEMNNQPATATPAEAAPVQAQTAEAPATMPGSTAPASTVTPTANAEDQARAQAALEQKLSEMNNQPVPATPAPAKAAPVQAQATETPAAMPSATATSANAEAQARAKAALEQKLSELSSQPTPTTTTTAAETAPAQTPQSNESTGMMGMAAPESAQDQSVAQAALLEKLSQLSANPETSAAPTALPPQSPFFEMPTPAQAAPAVVMAPSSPEGVGSANEASTDLGLKPIVAPPLPISKNQEAQLQTLNAKYIANQISPQEYFKQREEIIGDH